MLRFAITAAALALVSTTAMATVPAGYQLTWHDEFNGTAVDSALWNVDTKKRDDAQQSLDAATVANGVLTIHTYSENSQHFTGFLSTSGKFETAYGYFEARIKFTPAPGEWCAFWLQSNSIGNPMGDPAKAGVEIDVVEHRAVNAQGQDISNWASINMHWDGYQAQHKHIGSSAKPALGAPSLTADYHVYAVLWTPQSYTYYLDGRQVWTTSSPVSQIPEHVRLTCEIRDKGWAGLIPAAGYGSYRDSRVGMDVDWVRVWQPKP